MAEIDNKSRVIALGYKRLAGKDTLGSMLVHMYGFTRLAFADQLKLEVIEQYGLPPSDVFVNKDVEYRDGPYAGRTPRDLLKEHGDKQRARHGNDYFTKLLIQKVVDLTSRGRDVVVTDMRLLVEAAAMREVGAKLVHVSRDIPRVSEADKHVTECELDGYQRWDLVIDNNGRPQQMVQQLIDQNLLFIPIFFSPIQ